MEHRRFERMALNISQEYRLRCAVQFKVENRSMERLFLKRMKKRVLVQCDQLRRAGRAIARSLSSYSPVKDRPARYNLWTGSSCPQTTTSTTRHSKSAKMFQRIASRSIVDGFSGNDARLRAAQSCQSQSVHPVPKQ